MALLALTSCQCQAQPPAATRPAPPRLATRAALVLTSGASPPAAAACRRARILALAGWWQLRPADLVGGGTVLLPFLAAPAEDHARVVQTWVERGGDALGGGEGDG